jgi:type II secretory ATPase GspE/PulE/Tfp pilus assembly ATPase PilB-like protein
MAKKQKQTQEELQPWQLFPPVEVVPAISDKSEQQSQLIQARQSPGFPVAGGQIAHAMQNRAEQILLDYTQQGVGIRYMVDGLWEQVPPLARDAGDAMLVALKLLAQLNPQDRRSAQAGKMLVKAGRDKWDVTLQSQGVQSGERVLLRLTPQKMPFETLADLGMRDKMIESYKELLNGDDGLIVVSAPKGLGLTTTWQITIEAADKFVRDFQSIEPKSRPEPETINVNPNYYDDQAGPSAAELMRSMLLKEPDVFLFPEIPDEESLSKVCDQLMKNHKHAYTRLVASDAVEAYARLIGSYRGIASKLVGTIQGVINQRLARRLCENCKQGFQPHPALLQKLGIPAGRVSLLYQPFVPPPIEQQVDEKGRPAPIPPCPQCGGRGYFGRIAIFELLQPGKQLKDAITKTNDLTRLRAIAKAEGHRNLQAEAVLTVARGLTSLDEMKRVFSGK